MKMTEVNKKIGGGAGEQPGKKISNTKEFVWDDIPDTLKAKLGESGFDNGDKVILEKNADGKTISIFKLDNDGKKDLVAVEDVETKIVTKENILPKKVEQKIEEYDVFSQHARDEYLKINPQGEKNLKRWAGDVHKRITRLEGIKGQPLDENSKRRVAWRYFKNLRTDSIKKLMLAELSAVESENSDCFRNFKNKFGDFFKVNLYSREGTGDWIRIGKYDEKKDIVEFTSGNINVKGKKGKREKANIDKLEELLEKYTEKTAPRKKVAVVINEDKKTVDLSSGKNIDTDEKQGEAMQSYIDRNTENESGETLDEVRNSLLELLKKEEKNRSSSILNNDTKAEEGLGKSEMPIKEKYDDILGVKLYLKSAPDYWILIQKCDYDKEEVEVSHGKENGEVESEMMSFKELEKNLKFYTNDKSSIEGIEEEAEQSDGNIPDNKNTNSYVEGSAAAAEAEAERDPAEKRDNQRGLDSLNIDADNVEGESVERKFDDLVGVTLYNKDTPRKKEEKRKQVNKMFVGGVDYEKFSNREDWIRVDSIDYKNQKVRISYPGLRVNGVGPTNEIDSKNISFKKLEKMLEQYAKEVPSYEQLKSIELHNKNNDDPRDWIRIENVDYKNKKAKIAYPGLRVDGIGVYNKEQNKTISFSGLDRLLKDYVAAEVEASVSIKDNTIDQRGNGRIEVGEAGFEWEDEKDEELEKLLDRVARARESYVSKDREIAGVFATLREKFGKYLTSTSDNHPETNSERKNYQAAVTALLNYRLDRLKGRNLSSEELVFEMDQMMRYYRREEKINLYDARLDVQGRSFDMKYGKVFGWIAKKSVKVDGRVILAYVIRVLLATAAGYAAGWALNAWLVAGTTRFALLLVRVPVAVAASLAVFLAAAYAINLPDVRNLTAKILRRSGNRGDQN